MINIMETLIKFVFRQFRTKPVAQNAGMRIVCVLQRRDIKVNVVDLVSAINKKNR